jgi:enterochelin esterase-like enzyme
VRLERFAVASHCELNMPYTGLAILPAHGPAGAFERPVWTLTPADGSATTAVVFLDGELYVERVKAPEVLRRLWDQRAVPPAVAVFVSNGGAAARHADFVCRPAYASSVATTLVDRIRREFPAVREFVIAGLSLSGLAAAYVATRHPGVFQVAVCQSPSFWWERGRFAAELCPAARPDQAFWICVGDRETEAGVSHPPSGLRQELTQIQGCAVAIAALQANGYRIRHREYDGGHDPACWQDDLALALPWALRRQA